MTAIRVVRQRSAVELILVPRANRGATLRRRFGRIGALVTAREEEEYEDERGARRAQLRAAYKLLAKGYRVEPACPLDLYTSATADVARTPDDPRAFAKLADLLEAHGDPRSGLIRVQIALSRGYSAELEVEERELFARHSLRFLRPGWHPENADAQHSVTWRYGYIHSLATAVGTLPEPTVEFAPLSWPGRAHHPRYLVMSICNEVRSVATHDSGRFLREVTLFEARHNSSGASVRHEFLLEGREPLFRASRIPREVSRPS